MSSGHLGRTRSRPNQTSSSARLPPLGLPPHPLLAEDVKGTLATESGTETATQFLPYPHLDLGAESEPIGGRDAVLVPPVDPLQLLGADADPPALLHQHLELRHLHLGGQTGAAVPVTYQSLQRRRVDTEGTAYFSWKVDRPCSAVFFPPLSEAECVSMLRTLPQGRTCCQFRSLSF